MDDNSDSNSSNTKPDKSVNLNYHNVFDWAGNAQEVRWLVEDLIPLGHLTLIQAAQKVGKSTLARNLISCVATGQDFLGRTTRQGGVVYLPLEEDPASVRRHLLSLGIAEDSPVVIPTPTSSTKSSSSARGKPIRDLPSLEIAIRDNQPSLVVIDPLMLFLRLGSLNAYDKVYAAMDPFINLAQTYSCAIVLVHHESKTSRQNVGHRGIGSVALPASVSTTISMQRQHDVRTLDSEGRNTVDFHGAVVSMDNRGVISLAGSIKSHIAQQYSGAILEGMASVKEAPTLPEIEMMAEGDVKEIKQAILYLIKQGQIVHVSGRGVRGDPKRYALGPGGDTGTIDDGSEF